MKALYIFLIIIILFIACDDEYKPNDNEPKEYDTLSVMSYNLYFGANIFPLLLSESVDDLAENTLPIYKEILEANDFNDRGKKIAEMIAENDIDIVCLQEVAKFYSQEKSDYIDSNVTPNADILEIDYLDVIMSNLNALGKDYVLISYTNNSDEEFPSTFDNINYFDIRMVEGDAIIAKSSLNIVAENSLRYTDNIRFSLPAFPIDTISLYKSVTYAQIYGVTLANTHLEIGLGDTQERQADELLDLFSDRDNVILAGDFNSGPQESGGFETPSYENILLEYLDTYEEINPGGELYTCCQDSLNQVENSATSRIDIVFYKGNRLKVLDFYPLGNTIESKTDGGRWASDHIAVVSVIQIEK